jgi:hypothetical protein
MVSLTTKKYIQQFGEKVTEGKKDAGFCGADGVLCGGWVNPVGKADRGQSKAKTAAVSH